MTVASTDQLQTVAASIAADSINLLPQLPVPRRRCRRRGGINNHQGSINGLSLRGFGTIRTLALVNGQRVVGNISTGVVDITRCRSN